MSKGNGRTMYLGQGTTYAPESYDFIYDASTTKPHGFEIGDRVIKPNGDTFTLGMAKGTLNTAMGVKPYFTQSIAYASIQTAVVAGDREVKLTVAATDGDANSGLVAADELRGGTVVIGHSAAATTQARMITGNTAVAVGGGTITIYVDAPFKVACSTSLGGEAMSNPYAGLANTIDGTKSVVGVPTVAATTGQYTWVQTAGKIWVAPQSRVGATTMIRAAYWRHDGSLDIRALAGTFPDAHVTDQLAGYVINNAQDASQGAPFVQMIPLN